MENPPFAAHLAHFLQMNYQRPGIQALVTLVTLVTLVAQALPSPGSRSSMEAPTPRDSLSSLIHADCPCLSPSNAGGLISLAQSPVDLVQTCSG